MKTTHDIILEQIKQNPFKIYDTLVFLSSEEKGDDPKQDFALLGDPNAIMKHIAVLMYRHQAFREVVYAGVMLYEMADFEPEKVKP